MNRFNLVDRNQLEPEQKTVLNICTLPSDANEFVLVQGVAGSGKTTIALHVLENLGESAANQPPADRPSLLLLTYSRKLADYCANTLRDRPALAKAGLVSEN